MAFNKDRGSEKQQIWNLIPTRTTTIASSSSSTTTTTPKFGRQGVSGGPRPSNDRDRGASESCQVTVQEKMVDPLSQKRREAGYNEVSDRTQPSHERMSEGEGEDDGRYGDNSNINSNRSRSRCRYSCNNNNYDDDNNTNIDVLITHGPPLGMCDFIPDDVDDQQQGTTSTGTGTGTGTGTHAGCYDLLTTIQQRVKLKIVIFGHIHEGYGCVYDGMTIYIHVSIMNHNYEACNLPIVIDLPDNHHYHHHMNHNKNDESSSSATSLLTSLSTSTSISSYNHKATITTQINVS